MHHFDSLLVVTPSGLYCPAGDFHIDPHGPVERAIITHAHSDHARWGCGRYLAPQESEHLMRMRLGDQAALDFLPFGKALTIGGVQVGFHPSGHMLGAAQVRLEIADRVAVVTGDYKLAADPTCSPWEPIPCHLMVTESTFGLPIYRWQEPSIVAASINEWWRQSRDEGTSCVLYGYAVGKSQRLLAMLDTSIGPIYTHGAVERGVAAYRASGLELPDTTYVGSITGKHDWRGSMILAVPSAHGTGWIKKFGKVTTGLASGWMAVRGARRRRAIDRGFVLSDHVDWTNLLDAVQMNNPETVWVTHGFSATVARYLNEQGREAYAIESHVRSEFDEDTAEADEVSA